MQIIQILPSIEHLNLTMVKVTPAGFELALRHLKTLKHFGFHNKRTRFAAPYKNADIWAILLREKIMLSTIFTDWSEPKELGVYL